MVTCNMAFLDFILFNFEGSAERMGAYPNLASLALRYAVFHRKQALIPDGLYPIKTNVHLISGRAYISTFREIADFDKTDDNDEVWFIRGLAAVFNPRMNWAVDLSSLSYNPDFNILSVLIYEQSKSVYCEKLSLDNDQAKYAYEEIIEGGGNGKLRRQLRCGVGNEEMTPLYELIRTTINFSRSSVLDDRLTMSIKLHSQDPEWEAVRDGWLVYYVNRKLSRLAFSSNMDYEKAVSIATLYSCKEICTSSEGDFLNIVNIEDAIDQFNLIMALTDGKCKHRFKPLSDEEILEFQRMLFSIN
jgi:hypothetical protein